MNREHAIEVEETVRVPDDGLVLGNWDLSVCLCQAPYSLAFRFGKSDVWERRPVALRPDQIDKLAEVLRVSPDCFFSGNGGKAHKGGPVGKMRQLFDTAFCEPNVCHEDQDRKEEIATAQQMRESKDLSEPPCRRRLQTALSRFDKESR